MLTFDEQAARRIIEQIRWAEGQPRTRTPNRNQPLSFGTNAWQPCKNQNGSDAPAYGLAAVVDVTTLDGDDRPIWLIDQPSGTPNALYVVLGADGVPANGYGACTFGPNVRFLYDGSGPPAAGDTWGPAVGQWEATLNGDPGILLVGGVIDATDQIAFGGLQASGSSGFIVGITLGGILKGSTGNVEIYRGGIDTGQFITVINLFGDVGGGKWAACSFDGMNWYIVAAEC